MLKILQDNLHGNPFLNNTMPDFGLDREKAFVCHFHGNNSNKEKCKIYIEEIKNNKWWSSLNK